MEDKLLSITYKGSKVTARVLLQLMKLILLNDGKIVHGEQSLEKLNLQNKQLENVEINSKDLKAMRKEMKKYAVDFSITKDEAGLNYIFFKGQDVDRISKALENTVKKFESLDKDKEPMQQKMERAKETAKGRQAERQQDSPELSEKKIGKIKDRGEIR